MSSDRRTPPQQSPAAPLTPVERGQRPTGPAVHVGAVPLKPRMPTAVPPSFRTSAAPLVPAPPAADASTIEEPPMPAAPLAAGADLDEAEVASEPPPSALDAALASAATSPPGSPVLPVASDQLHRTLTAVERLRATVTGAGEHFAAFQRAVDTRLELISAYTGAADQHVRSLREKLADAEGQTQGLTLRLAVAEEQTARLMSLYVATFQLHATLDPAIVQRTIADIAENLLGAERFALLLRADDSGRCDVALAQGLEAVDSLAGGVYRGGDPVIDATLDDGEIRVGPLPGSDVLAAVPLKVQDSTVGALVIYGLLAHKAGLTPADREMLELLASHAASALFLAQLHAQADRKLRTLEDLVALARRH